MLNTNTNEVKMVTNQISRDVTALSMNVSSFIATMNERARAAEIKESSQIRSLAPASPASPAQVVRSNPRQKPAKPQPAGWLARTFQ
jgi:hypothetical protein